MTTQRRLALTLLLLAVPCPRALADDLHVPKDFDTIQAAVDASADGDTIFIHGGTYAEAVLVEGKTNLVLWGLGKVVIAPGGGGAALTLSGCDGCDVQAVRTTGADIGIHLVDCVDGSLFKCRAEGVAQTGFVLDGCTGTIVTTCTIKDTGNDGIALGEEFASPSNECWLVKNKILRAGDVAINVNGADNIIELNVATEPVDRGYRTEDNPGVVHGNSFTKNKVKKAGGAGFRIHGDDNILLQNKAIACAGDGFQLTLGTGHVVQECKVIKAGGDGIFSEAVATNVVLTDNIFKKPGANGIDVDGDGASVSGNKVTGSLGNGFAVIGNNGTWTGNTAKGSADDGFEVAGTGNTLTFNVAKGSKAGFDLNDLSGGGNEIDETNDFKTTSP